MEVLGQVRSLGGSNGNNNNNSNSNSAGNAFSAQIERWNTAMDAFKICQPCVSYDTLSASSKETYNANGDRYGSGDERRMEDNDNGDDGDGDDNEDDSEDDNDVFVCQTNLQRDEPINQCEVFVENGKDTMTVATYRDILLAASQGTVTGIDLSPSSDRRRGRMVLGEAFVQPRHTYLSLVLLVLAMGYFMNALARLFEKDRAKHGGGSHNNNKNGMDQPLVHDVVAAVPPERTKTRKDSQSVSTTNAVTNKKIREEKTAEKAAEKQRKKDQKQQKREQKSILKQSRKYDAEEASFGEESTHYSRYL